MERKSRIGLGILFAFVFTVTGCAGNAGKDVVYGQAEEVIMQGVEGLENVMSFDVDEDGCIYAGMTTQNGDVCVQTLCIADDTGSRTCYTLDEVSTPRNITFYEENIYYTVPEWLETGERQVLKRFCPERGMQETIHVFEQCSDIKKMEVMGNSLYILGTDPADIDFSTGSGDGYYDSGEILLRFDLQTGAEETVMDQDVLNFSITPAGNLMIYGHDEGGFYFSTGSGQKENFGEKQYQNLGMIDTLCACADDQYIYSSLSNHRNSTGASMGGYGKEGIIDFLEDMEFLYGDVRLRGDRLYFVDNRTDSEKKGTVLCAYIERILLSDLNRAIRLVSAEWLAETPDSQGFSMEQTALSYDSFALTVLSQDAGYDLCILNSRQEFAASIRDKGAFYPLNEIDGVTEYIESCFPFVQQAAVNENGDIWMLPVDIKINTLVYNENQCKLFSEDFAEISLEEFLYVVQKARAQEDAAYGIGAAYYTELLLSDYLMQYEKFDSEEFRGLAKLIKEEIFGCENAFSDSNAMNRIKMTGNEKAYGNVMFSIVADPSEHEVYSNVDGMRIMRVPMFTEDAESIVTCTFLCVNPSSENLNLTLEYISRLAKSMLAEEENLLLSDAGIYEESVYYADLKKVCSKGVVRFSYENELFLTDFYAYIEGRISLEEFIAEADRKIAAYLNE